MARRTLDDLDLDGKTVLTRVDINVPMDDSGHVTDMTRIERIKPTIDDILEAGGKPVLLAHFGRPKGVVHRDYSLERLMGALTDGLGHPVAFAEDCVGETAQAAVDRQKPGTVLLLENTRFHPGETKNDPDLARRMAELGDVYVNDAFSAAHRAHASTEGIAHHLPAAAGRLMEAELSALEDKLTDPTRPLVALVGGAKVSTKLELLSTLVEKCDHLIIGGGMANTFLAAQGLEVGTSLCEHDLTDTASAILEKARATGCDILLPSDLVVARKFEAHAPHETVAADACPADAMILDAGPATVARIASLLSQSATMIWNGPLGAFETPPFDAATSAAARHAAQMTRAGTLVTVAGGGDTVAALSHAGVEDDFSYVSTAGGAFLEWMEGKTLPGVAALES